MPLLSPCVYARFFLLLVMAATCMLQPALAEQNSSRQNTGRIVKWKDEKGVTHYGDSVPPQYINRESSLMNRQGITVKRNKPADQAQDALDLAKIEQDKKDKALLGAFTHADEIDLARDRNLQFDMIALDNLEQEKSHLQQKLHASETRANDFTKRKKAIPEDLKADIVGNKAEIVKTDKLISERKLQIETTRKRFDDDKKRYILLRNQHTEESQKTPSTPPSVSQPN
ncbi:MAG: DUF4124 domain-containing protein [Betaproteobacteria bacterium HGW-Betaproteobacteria-22]|nr:MAG: DUF4124 domain-containing protein [Betaproteobacteria bacterium HGW-Betaproteobacteria-22]